MAVYQVRGITLAHQDSREVDRLLILYTHELGKQTVIARGSRKISSKLAGSLEPFIEGWFSCAQGARVDTVTGVEVLNIFRNLRADPDRVLVASYCSMVLDAATKDRQRDERLYQLLQEILRTLDAPQVPQRVLFISRWYFVWRLLQLLGHQPELFYDRKSKRALRGSRFVFDTSRGTVRVAPAAAAPQDTLTKSVIKLLRAFHTQSLRACIAIRFSPAVAQEVERVTQQQINYVLEGDYAFSPFFIQ